MEGNVSYMGNEPFAFISYAAKDRERAYPIIQALLEKGYRVWYDEGITPGRQWDENIAARVSACNCVVAMLSEAYFESENCVDELKYSRDLEKPLVLLSLGDVSLIGGMALRVGRHPRVNYDPEDGIDLLIAELEKIEIFKACHEASVKQGKTAKKTSGTFRKLKGVVATFVAILAGLTAAELLSEPNDTNGIVEPTPTAIVYPVVEVVDNDLLTATVVDITKNADQYSMEMKIENKSEQKLFYSMENSYLNGALCDLDQWGEIEGNNTVVIPFSWSKSELESYGILKYRDDVTIIEGSLMYSLQPDVGFQSARIVYYPLGEEQVATVDVLNDIERKDVTGTYDAAEGIEVLSVVPGNCWREDGTLKLELFLQNKSDYDQTVILHLDMISGYPAISEQAFSVEAGRVCRVEYTDSAFGSLIGEDEQVVFSGTIEAAYEDGSSYVSERFALFY